MDFKDPAAEFLTHQTGRPPPAEPPRVSPPAPQLAPFSAAPAGGNNGSNNSWVGWLPTFNGHHILGAITGLQSVRPAPAVSTPPDLNTPKSTSGSSGGNSSSNINAPAAGPGSRQWRQETIQQYLVESVPGIHESLSAMSSSVEQGERMHEKWNAMDRMPLQRQEGGGRGGGEKAAAPPAPSSAPGVDLVELCSSDDEVDEDDMAIVVEPAPAPPPPLPISPAVAAASLLGLMDGVVDNRTARPDLETDEKAAWGTSSSKRARALEAEAQGEDALKRARLAEAAERRRRGSDDGSGQTTFRTPDHGKGKWKAGGDLSDSEQDIIEVTVTSPPAGISKPYGLRQNRRRDYRALVGDPEVIVLDDDEGEGGSAISSFFRRRRGSSSSRGGGQDGEQQQGPGSDGIMESCLSKLLDDSAQGDPSLHYQFSQGALQDMMSRLIRDELLNDEVLNRAVNLLSKDERSKNVLLFNTFWYEKIKDGKFDEATQWFTKALGDRDISKLRLICAPVNISNAHWVLVVVDLGRGTVGVWDPAGSEHGVIAANVREMVKKAANKQDLVLVHPPSSLPQQSDSINCGLFVILYLIHLCFQGPVNSSSMPLELCSFSVRADDLYRYRMHVLAWILSSQVTPPQTDPVLQSLLIQPARHLDVGNTRTLRKVVLGILDDDANKRVLFDTAMQALNPYSDTVVLLDSQWYRHLSSGDGVQASASVMVHCKDLLAVKCICAPIYVDQKASTSPLLVRIELAAEPRVIHLHGSEGLFDSDAVSQHIDRFMLTHMNTPGMLKKQWPIELCEDSKPCDLALVIHAMYTCLQHGVQQLPPLDFSDDGLFRYKFLLFRWLLRCIL